MAGGVYLNSLFGGFVYDDRHIIVENPLVRGKPSLKAILASSYWQRGASSPQDGLYRPLAIWSYALNWRLGGGNPFYFHLANVILHGVVTLLLYLTMGLLGVSPQAAGLGALTFAVLPIHVEAVSWAVGRAEILAAAFALAAWLLLHQQKSTAKIIAGLSCYGAALLSKESAAAFPAALVLGEIFRHPGSIAELAGKRLMTWLSVFGVLALYLAWRDAVLGSVFFAETPYFSTQSRLVIGLTMAKFLWRGWLWPMASGLGLCADHSRPGFADAAATELAAWAAAFAVAGIIAWAVHAFKSRRSATAFSILLFFCLAAPLLNILMPMEILGAERIMYIPSIAFCVFVAAAWDGAHRRGWTARSWLKGMMGACLLGWSSITMARNRVWRDNESLSKSMAACAPDNLKTLACRGVVSARAGRHAEARDLFGKILKMRPGFAPAVYDIGKSYYEEGDWANAKLWFQKLGNPADMDALCFLGLIAEREGRPRDAMDNYARVLERNPAHLEARRNLGLLLFKRGKVRESVEQLRAYLEGAPPPSDAAEIEEFLRRVAPK